MDNSVNHFSAHSVPEDVANDVGDDKQNGVVEFVDVAVGTDSLIDVTSRDESVVDDPTDSAKVKRKRGRPRQSETVGKVIFRCSWAIFAFLLQPK